MLNKYIMDGLKLIFPNDYDKMNMKIEEVISKLPKEEINKKGGKNEK